MKIKVSNAFAKFINATALEMGFNVVAKVVTMSQSSYKINVDYDLFRACDYGDFDAAKGVFKTIVITYPQSYNAAPQYLTTYALNKEFNRLGVQSVEDLKSMIREMCEI